ANSLKLAIYKNTLPIAGGVPSLNLTLHARQTLRCMTAKTKRTFLYEQNNLTTALPQSYMCDFSLNYLYPMSNIPLLLFRIGFYGFFCNFTQKEL
ncbi:MAG: hypothetical protein KUG73_01750, partial [Pseudomonadales bacterium]|nr:hypothetical protein [Pseudomonadales bacterium]